MKLVKRKTEKPAKAPGKDTALVPARPQTAIIRLIGEVDRPFLLLVVTLLCIGSVMIFSASYAYAKKNFGDPYYFVKSQLIWAILGITVMAVIAWIVDYRWLKKWAVIIFAGTVAINIAVPIVGYAAKGATRQIQLGPINFQPSEIMKFAVVLFFAAYISKNYSEIHSFKKGVLPFAFYGGLAAASIIIQQHLSATIIILILVLVMLHLSGTKARYVGVTVGAIGGLALFVLTIGKGIIEKLVPHAVTRLLVWENPFAYMKDAATGDAGWQPSQSLYAISSGGFWGLGLGESNQKHGYLPEPQNDYIFSIVCEELGFFGAAIIIGIFIAFAWRGYKIAKNAPDRFTSLLVMGIVVQVVVQVALNIAVVTNSIPSTGIGLPFFSYGGTSLIILLAQMGVVLSISRYSFMEKG